MQTVRRTLQGLSSRSVTTSLRQTRWESTGRNQHAIQGQTQADRSQSGQPQTSPADAPGARFGDPGLMRKQGEGPAKSQPDHSPDYNVAVDYRTS